MGQDLEGLTLEELRERKYNILLAGSRENREKVEESGLRKTARTAGKVVTGVYDYTLKPGYNVTRASLSGLGKGIKWMWDKGWDAYAIAADNKEYTELNPDAKYTPGNEKYQYKGQAEMAAALTGGAIGVIPGAVLGAGIAGPIGFVVGALAGTVASGVATAYQASKRDKKFKWEKFHGISYPTFEIEEYRGPKFFDRIVNACTNAERMKKLRAEAAEHNMKPEEYVLAARRETRKKSRMENILMGSIQLDAYLHTRGDAITPKQKREYNTLAVLFNNEIARYVDDYREDASEMLKFYRETIK